MQRLAENEGHVGKGGPDLEDPRSGRAVDNPLLNPRTMNDDGGMMETGYRNGKLCYVELPADDVGVSARFYSDAFGWSIRRRDDGATAFDDTVGGVSGVWVTGRSPSGEPGILIYIMVENMDASIAAVREHGGEIVQGVGADAPEVTARFRDPAGNIMGLYQEPTLAS